MVDSSEERFISQERRVLEAMCNRTTFPGQLSYEPGSDLFKKKNPVVILH